VKPIASIVVAFFVVGCSRAPVEESLFFPTWSVEGPVPSGIVQGTLVQDDGCLYVQWHGQRAMVAWEDGMGFENGTLRDASGSTIVGIGEVIHGGGGYFGSRRHIEELSGESIPERCVPDDENDDRFAIIYEVEAGPFE